MKQNLTDTQVLVTGGAGFIGSHLVDRLLELGAKVTVVDNLITGNLDNLKSAQSSNQFTFIEADVAQPTQNYLPPNTKFNFILHLASPASPRGYMEKPIETYLPNSFGTHYLLEYARKISSTFLFASTSEAYGDPKEHPQKETYWGNVNPTGVRSCYDVSKRFGEMVVSTFLRQFGIDARIVRIFNTYGPRMDPKDGRVIPNFITQALNNQPLTVHGTGEQTRSFCYVDDLVEYLLRAIIFPNTKGEIINIGSSEEHSIIEFAKRIKQLINSSSKLTFTDRPEDDPSRRQPDITKAKKLLKYIPQISLNQGLQKTIDYFKTKT